MLRQQCIVFKDIMYCTNIHSCHATCATSGWAIECYFLGNMVNMVNYPMAQFGPCTLSEQSAPCSVSDVCSEGRVSGNIERMRRAKQVRGGLGTYSAVPVANVCDTLLWLHLQDIKAHVNELLPLLEGYCNLQVSLSCQLAHWAYLLDSFLDKGRRLTKISEFCVGELETVKEVFMTLEAVSAPSIHLLTWVDSLPFYLTVTAT